MKVSLICSATLFPLITFAFPANLLKNDIGEGALAEITDLVAKITRAAEMKRQSGLGKRAFGADAQRVSTTGQHVYIAPGPKDNRGPCPGLNTLANHGYISRSGVSSVVELTTASNEVFGMGLDLAAFLSAYSGVMAGDINSVSIGGKPGSGILSGGLTSSLGLIEEPQDPVSLNLPQFEQLIAMPIGPNGYDLTVMHPFRGACFNNSVATNGRFFAGPFTQFAVNTATCLFTYHFFTNYSAEHPDGYLDVETLKSFEGITGDKGNFQWQAGRERIPENWHRRPIGDDYGLVQFTADALGALKALPYMAVVGGNTGKPNTFTGVNAADLTGGVFNAETLFEGNNLMCFAFSTVNAVAPDILRGLVGNVLLAVQKLTDALNPILAELGCPAIAKYDRNLLSKFPGAGNGI